MGADLVILGVGNLLMADDGVGDFGKMNGNFSQFPQWRRSWRFIKSDGDEPFFGDVVRLDFQAGDFAGQDLVGPGAQHNIGGLPDRDAVKAGLVDAGSYPEGGGIDEPEYGLAGHDGSTRFGVAGYDQAVHRAYKIQIVALTDQRAILRLGSGDFAPRRFQGRQGRFIGGTAGIGFIVFYIRQLLADGIIL